MKKLFWVKVSLFMLQDSSQQNITYLNRNILFSTSSGKVWAMAIERTEFTVKIFWILFIFLLNIYYYVCEQLHSTGFSSESQIYFLLVLLSLLLSSLFEFSDLVKTYRRNKDIWMLSTVNFWKQPGLFATNPSYLTLKILLHKNK